MMLFRGVAIAMLPWLSTKYAPMAAAVTIVAMLRAGRDRRATLTLLAPIGIGLATWFGFFVWIWGSPSPSAPYGLSEPMTWRHLAHGGPGLIFDQDTGSSRRRRSSPSPLRASCRCSVREALPRAARWS